MSLILSLFCPICQNPYNDSDKRPRIGSCRHNVCQPCIESNRSDGSPVTKTSETFSSSDCPVCDEKDAFKEVLYNFELCKMLEAFNEKVTEENFQRISQDPQKLNFGVCKCCLASERLRICVTCAEKSQLFKKLPNGKFSIMDYNKAVHLAKSVYLCSDCIADGQPDHDQHLFLPLSKVDVIEADLEYWHYIINAVFLERKMHEQWNQPISESGQSFNRILLQFKRMALGYEVKMRAPQFQNLESEIMLTRLGEVDIHSIPELAKAKHKSFEMAQTVANRILKRQERHLWYQRDGINRHVEKMRRTKSDDPQFIKNKEELLALSEKFESFRIAELTQLEADQMDEEINANLEEELRKLEFYDEAPNKKKFHVYKVICNILKNANEQTEMIEELLEEEATFIESFLDKRWKQIERMSDDELAKKLFTFEVVERSFKFDQLKIRHMESTYGSLEGYLLWEQWYPNNQDENSEDFYYNHMLGEEFQDQSKSVSGARFAVSLC